MRVYFIHANQLASIIVRITNKAEVVYFIIVLKFRVQWSRMVKGKFGTATKRSITQRLRHKT